MYVCVWGISLGTNIDLYLKSIVLGLIMVSGQCRYGTNYSIVANHTEIVSHKANHAETREFPPGSLWTFIGELSTRPGDMTVGGKSAMRNTK